MNQTPAQVPGLIPVKRRPGPFRVVGHGLKRDFVPPVINAAKDFRELAIDALGPIETMSGTVISIYALGMGIVMILVVPGPGTMLAGPGAVMSCFGAIRIASTAWEWTKDGLQYLGRACRRRYLTWQQDLETKENR